MPTARSFRPNDDKLHTPCRIYSHLFFVQLIRTNLIAHLQCRAIKAVEIGYGGLYLYSFAVCMCVAGATCNEEQIDICHHAGSNANSQVYEYLLELGRR